MITKEDTYKLAFEEQARVYKEKTKRHELFLQAAYHAQPRLKEIETQQSAFGAQLAIQAMGNPAVLPEMKKRLDILAAEKKQLLEKAGVPEIVFDCKLCRDTGYVNGKICDCIKQRAAKIAVQEMNKQMPLASSRFEDFDLSYYPDKTDQDGANPRRRMTAVLAVCRQYAEEFKGKNDPNLLFMGQAGLGKTHLTLAILSELLQKGFLPVYGPAENLFGMIEKEKFAGENRGAYELMAEADLLVIDDLGAEMATSFTRSALYNLVNTRILTQKPTIINTNLTMREMESRYSARISSRLIGNYRAYKFIGDDIRQKKAVESKHYGM